MKFNKKYPNAVYMDLQEEMLKGGNPEPCMICKELTFWVEINFQGHICSEECLKTMNSDFFKAYNNRFRANRSKNN